MMQIEYRLKMGQDEFVIKVEAKNEKEFFQKMSFFSSLPKTAPGGSADLKLVVRDTKKGKYYSLVSEKEKLEFQLGQHKEGDTLYAKDWVPLFQGDNEDSQQAAAPAFGQQAQTQVAQQQAPAAQAPAPMFGAGQMPVPQSVAAPAQQQAAPVAAPAAPVTAPAAAAPAVNPAVAATAVNVLSRFGIQK